MAIALPYFLSVYNQENKMIQDKPIQEQSKDILNTEFNSKDYTEKSQNERNSSVIQCKF